MKKFLHPSQLAGLMLITFFAPPTFAATLIIGDDYNVTTSTTGFALNNGANFGINPPTTRLTGSAAATLRYIQTVTSKSATAYAATNSKLVVAAAANSGRFTLSADGIGPFDFASALGTGTASPTNPVVYDVSNKMINTSSAIARFSFGFGTQDANVDVLDFALQIWRTNSSANRYWVQKRIDTLSSGVADLNEHITRLAIDSYGTELAFLIRVTDAGMETTTFNSRVQVSLNGGSTWIYDTSTDDDLPNGWRFDGAARNFTWDQAPLTGTGQFTYDDFSVNLFPVKTWNGGGSDDNWTSANNWGGVAPRSGDSLIFGGTTRPSNANNISAALLTLVPSLTFDDGGFSLSGNNLTISRTITNVVGNNTLNNGVSLSSSVEIRATAGTLTLGGNLTGNGGLTKTGSGALVLSGANAYSGITAVSQGTMTVNGSLGAGGAVLVNAAGTLNGTGTISRAVSVSGTVSAGNSVGTLTTGALTLNSGGTNVWEISSATGTAGTDWDLVDAGANNVDVQATTGSPFTFKLSAIDLNNFDNDSSYSWPAIAGTVQSFSADKFAIDATGFTNDLAGGSFLIEPGSLNVRFTNNHAPIASIATYGYPKGVPLKPAKISIASFLTSNTSDPDGDGRSLLLVTSTNAVVSTNATDITIGSMSDSGESLQYVVRDVRNYRAGDTVRTATNYIHLVRTNATGAVNISVGSGGSVNVTFYGIPNYQYIIQRSPDLSDWTDVATNSAAANGLLQYTETPPWNPTFYRVRTE